MNTFLLEVDKFLCGFFIGVILFYIVFESTTNVQTPTIINDVNFFQSLADKLENSETSILKRQYTLPDLDADLSFHHDKISSEALMLRKTISISCYVMTTLSCASRATAISKTWGKRCSVIRYLVNVGSMTCGLPVLYLESKNEKEKYKEAISKIYKIYVNESDWTLIATEDTYVIMENIYYIINKTSPESKVMLGYATNFALSHINPELYNKFSSVILLTKSTVAQLAQKSRMISCKTKKTDLNMYDLLCMKKLGIRREITGSKFLNVVPPELRVIPSTKLTKYLTRHVASFRYVSPRKMRELEFLVYHLRPFGLP